MLRNLLTGCLLLLLAASASRAQDWAVKMFDTTTHDFGSVARGAKAQFRFQIKNLYEEPVHIESARSSCGCTGSQITRHDLKTFEVGEIVAELNTRDMQLKGQKSATITVVFDKPFHAEVQLNVTGFIRSDVVLTPGAVDFGTVESGTSLEKRIVITYVGRPDWALKEARVPETIFDAKLVETARNQGHVAYELIVKLSKDTPSGYLKDQIILVTNDARAPELAVDVEGRVGSQITVSPSSLFMGIVAPGQQVTRQLVVRGKRPFKITGVESNGDAFDITIGSKANTTHLLPVVFTAGDKPGKVSEQIVLKTDSGAAPAFTAYAQVVAAQKVNAQTDPEDQDR